VSTELPKLRSDLLFSRQEGGQAAFVVKNPGEGQFFRLNEAEQFIATQLDGQTPLETVRLRTEKRFDVSLSPESLANFVTSLDQSKLLESGRSRAVRTARRKRLRGSILYLRFMLFDPDALLSWLAGRVGFCFRRGFVLATSGLILWALILALADWADLRQDLVGLLRWDVLIWLLAAAFAVGTAHELAHGVTCKHFGGEVRELGLLLMYFQPALYCNVSDAWLFPERRKRLWVGFAGPYFELVLWACALLIWRLTDTETSLNHGALAVVATSGLKTLLNFNPLLKLDGYYLLSDLLAVPNLRKNSYVCLGNAVKRLLGMGRTAPLELASRQTRVYLSYGLISAVFSISALGYALIKFGGLLLQASRPGTLMLAAGFLAMKVSGRFRRLFGNSSETSDSDHSPTAGTLEGASPAGLLDRGPATSAPEDWRTPEPGGSLDTPTSSAAEEAKAPRRRKKLRRLGKRLVFGVAFLSAVLPVVFFVRMELRISGSFVIQPVQNADARAEVGGTIEAIYVDEGSRVRKGDLIARLSDRDNRTALLRTQADIDQNTARLKVLEAGARPEEIELARTAVARAEGRLHFARKNLERDQQLLQEQLISQKDFEASKQAVVDGQSDLADARQRLQLLLAGSRPEDIEAAKAGIAELETQRRYLENQLAHVKVTSPVAGIVTTPSDELKEKVGQVAREGDLIAKIHQLDEVEVQTPVSEKDIGDIKVGQRVALKARAYPDETFFGAVTAIGATVQTPPPAAVGSASTALTANSASGSAKTVLVTTRIANHDLLLKPGMTGIVKISCGERRIFDLLTRRLARTIKVEYWPGW
jgi:multidrug resistance efflux pump